MTHPVIHWNQVAVPVLFINCFHDNLFVLDKVLLVSTGYGCKFVFGMLLKLERKGATLEQYPFYLGMVIIQYVWCKGVKDSFDVSPGACVLAIESSNNFSRIKT